MLTAIEDVLTFASRLSNMPYQRLTLRQPVETTKLSSKGQVVLPSGTRASRGWKTGTVFAIEETPEGVLLRPLKPFTQTRIEDVFGMAQYQGPIRTLDEMEQAILTEARRHRP